MRTKDCIICTDKIKKKNLVALTCCHIFHTSCVIKLVRKRTRKCPLCRTKIRWNVKQLEKHKNLS
jgi:hypothetical protein